MREAKRIFNIRFILLTVILLAVNAFLILRTHLQDRNIMQAYDRMLELMEENRGAETSNREAATSAWLQYYEEQHILYDAYVALYGNPGWEEDPEKRSIADKAREILMGNADYVDGFTKSIQKKMEDALQLARSGIYEPGGSDYRNLLKTRYDLAKIADLKVTVSNGVWLEELFSYQYIQVFVLILMFATVYSFFSERKSGLYYIVHATENGRAGLYLKRFLLLFLEAFMLNALFYLESAILLLCTLGGIEGVFLPAASSEVLLLTSGTLSRLEFAGLLIVASAVTTLVLAMLLWCILSFFNNTNVGLILYLVLIAADLLVHITVLPKMNMRALRFINIYYLIFPQKALNYYNWGYSFGITSLFESTAVLVLVLGLGVCIVNLYRNISTYFTGRANFIEKVVGYIGEVIMRLLGEAPNILREGYKILISQKAVIVLLLLVFLAGKIEVGPGVMYGAADSYLSGYYYKEAEGLSYGDELEVIYNKYLAEYEDFKENLDYNLETAESLLRYRESLIAHIRGNIDYIKQLNEQGTAAVVLAPYEYNGAFGEAESSAQMQLALLNVIAVIVVSCGFISYEKKNEMHRLALASCNRRSWLMKKFVTNWLLIAILEGITYGLYYRRIFETYDLGNLRVPLKSLPMFRDYPLNPSIQGFIVIDLFFKFALLVSLSAVMCFISIYVKYIYCLAVGMLAVISQLLYLIGVETMEKVSIGRYVAMIPCLLEGSAAANICYVFTAMTIVAGCLFFLYIMKNETTNR